MEHEIQTTARLHNKIHNTLNNQLQTHFAQLRFIIHAQNVHTQTRITHANDKHTKELQQTITDTINKHLQQHPIAHISAIDINNVNDKYEIVIHQSKNKYI